MLKNINNNNKQCPPSKISFKNEIITSPKQISNIANQYFKNKIIKIRQNLSTSKYNPIYLLNKLIKPNQYNMNIKLKHMLAT